MKTIMLVCNAGMSTSLLVTKMQEAATFSGVEAEIFAVPVSEVPGQVASKSIDVLLVGPQVRFMLDDYRQKYGAAMKVADINMMDYGTMNGANVFKAAMDLMES